MTLHNESSPFRLATQHIVQLAAILLVVALLVLGLYGVAREAGKLMQLSRDAATSPEVTPIERPLASHLPGPGAWTVRVAGE